MSQRFRHTLAGLALLALPASVAAQPVVSVEPATPDVTFIKPVGVKAAPGQGGRLYVVEQGDGNARSRVMTLVPGDAAPAVFLDLTDRVVAGGEQGLLGLAFHPDYAANGRLLVYYTGRTGAGQLVSRVSEVRRSASDPLQADPATESVVLEVPQPFGNHNGGTVAFGPDGYLYFGLGDGGGQGDPRGNGQDLTTLLGAILRLDVDVPGVPYGIPPDNPFAGTSGPEREEIWAYGFRNPYRFSVSDAGLWVGDVGQNEWEEVDRVERGGNYGWKQVEGPVCYIAGCDLSAYEPPVVSYRHNSQGGYSITGGFVVQDPSSQLNNHYLYGDFMSGRMWALPIEGGDPVVLLESVPNGQGGQRLVNISAIEDAGGAILLVDYNGTIYQLSTPGTPTEGAPEGGLLALSLAGPNPSLGATAVRVRSDVPVRVTVIDVQGREVAVLWDGPAPSAPLAVDDALAPGVYTVRAVTAESVATLRMVRVR